MKGIHHGRRQVGPKVLGEGSIGEMLSKFLEESCDCGANGSVVEKIPCPSISMSSRFLRHSRKGHRDCFRRNQVFRGLEGRGVRGDVVVSSLKCQFLQELCGHLGVSLEAKSKSDFAGSPHLTGPRENSGSCSL